MNHNTHESHDRLDFTGWVVLNPNGAMELTRREGRLKAGERAVALTISVPKTLFEQPQLTATVTVPNDASPAQIDAKTVTALEGAIKAGIGMDVVVTIAS